MSGFTYRDAGVDIDLEARAIAALVSRLRYRREGAQRMLGKVGHFAGLIGFGSSVLALTTDGVGTKILVAERLASWRTVGIDCIAMNANDLLVMNIEPVAFVDYIATDSLDPEKMAQIGEGLNEGARLANLEIVGGETATLKGLVSGLDLAGACLGIQERGRVVTGESIKPGDLIVGVPSSGIHSNGLTLARKVVEEYSDYGERLAGGRTLGEEILTPTRIYLESLKVCKSADVHGMCHVTGGGLLNFLRLSCYGISIDRPLPLQEIFRWIQETGGIRDEEMYRTFNMGMGYAYISAPGVASQIVAMVPGAAVVGEVTERPGAWIRGIEVR